VIVDAILGPAAQLRESNTRCHDLTCSAVSDTVAPAAIRADVR